MHRFTTKSIFKKLRIFLYCLFLFSSKSFAQQYTLYTEQFPPFNFMQEQKLTGVSTQIIEAVFQKANLDYKFALLPWARTMEESKRAKSGFIFSISRRPDRENMYQWIGMIVPSTHSVYKKKGSDICIKQLADMKNYVIGTTNRDARESYLLANGFEKKDFQSLSGPNSYLRNYKLLKLGRAQLWPIPDAVAHHLAKSVGDELDSQLEKAFELKAISNSGYYLAANKEMPQEVITLIKQTLEEFVATDEYSQLLRRWGITLKNSSQPAIQCSRPS